MPGAKQPERGTKSPYSARYRVDVGYCTGLDLSHDAASLADTALRQAVNARVHDGIVLSRGGQSEEEAGMSGCIQGLVAIEGSGVRAVLATNEQGTTTRAAIALVDENLRQSPADASNFVLIDGDPFTEHPWEANRSSGNLEDSRPRIVYTWWNGNVVFQNADGDNQLYRLILPEEGIDAEDLGREELFQMIVPGEVSEVRIASFATLPQIGNVQGPEPLYMGTQDGGVVGYINGQLVRLLADSTFTGRVMMFTYNNQVYAAGDDKTMYQSNGWAAGGDGAGTAWTNITMPGGPTDFRPMAGIEGLGFGWIGGYDATGATGAATDCGYILKVDDSSGSPIITVAVSSIAGGTFLWSVDDFTIGPLGEIYAAFRHGTPASFFGEFGVFDGAALSSEYGWGESEAMCYRIAGTANKVYALGWGSDEPASFVVFDGSSTVDIVKWVGSDPSPFDMVLF